MTLTTPRPSTAVAPAPKFVRVRRVRLADGTVVARSDDALVLFRAIAATYPSAPFADVAGMAEEMLNGRRRTVLDHGVRLTLSDEVA